MKNLIKISLAFTLLPCILAVGTQAQPVDLSTEEAVIEELGKQKKAEFDKDKICIKRLKESTKIIGIGFFSLRYAGCHFDGAFVNSVYIEDGADLSKKALNALGWKKANQEQREKLALTWVEKGLLAFARVLYTKHKDFKDGEFHTPQVVSKENGEVVVTLWTSVMRRKIGFHHLEFRFAKDGNRCNVQRRNLLCRYGDENFCLSDGKNEGEKMKIEKLAAVKLEKIYLSISGTLRRGFNR